MENAIRFGSPILAAALTICAAPGAPSYCVGAPLSIDLHGADSIATLQPAHLKLGE